MTATATLAGWADLFRTYPITGMGARADLVGATLSGIAEGDVVSAGGLAFKKVTGSTAIPDFSGFIPLPPYRGAHWGIPTTPNDGSAISGDYSTELQAAVDYIGGTRSGGTLHLGDCMFGIASTVYVGEGAPVTIKGTGRGEITTSKTGLRAMSGTRIGWTGAAGGTMFKFTADRTNAGTGTRKEGGGLLEIHLDGYTTADIGVHVQSHCGSVMKIHTSYFTGVHFLADVLSNGLTTGPADNQRFRWNIHCDDVNTTSEPDAMIVITGSDTVSPAANTSLGTFEELRLSPESAAVAAHFGNCDALTIQNYYTGTRTTATGDGGETFLHASDTLPSGLGTTAADGRARHIKFGNVQATKAIVAKDKSATGTEANDITIDHLSRGNGAPLPIREAYPSQITWKTSEGDISARRVQGVMVDGIHSYGGTANAITVETGGEISTLVEGMRIRFTATSANTGATTIAVDDVAAKTAKTITGAALPAGYIRTDTYTEAVYDGTDWIVDRLAERGSGSGGEWVRYADGRQVVSDQVTLIYNSGSQMTGAWVYEKAFSARPSISGAVNVSDFGSVTPLPEECTEIAESSPTASSVTLVLHRIAGATNFGVSDETDAQMLASGYWY